MPCPKAEKCSNSSFVSLQDRHFSHYRWGKYIQVHSSWSHHFETPVPRTFFKATWTRAKTRKSNDPTIKCYSHLTEKAMAPHSSTFAWKIPWTEEPGGLQAMGSLELHTTERLHFHFSLSCIGEGNGNPLQYSCLENPRDVEASWAAIYGVAQSWTWLKRLSSSSSRVI